MIWGQHIIQAPEKWTRLTSQSLSLPIQVQLGLPCRPRWSSSHCLTTPVITRLLLPLILQSLKVLPGTHHLHCCVLFPQFLGCSGGMKKTLGSPKVRLGGSSLVQMGHDAQVAGPTLSEGCTSADRLGISLCLVPSPRHLVYPMFPRVHILWSIPHYHHQPQGLTSALQNYSFFLHL